MDETSFADRLTTALEGGSVYSFAQKSGIPESTLRKYLAGSMPGLDKLLTIANHANVTLDWLAADRGPMRPGQSKSQMTVSDADGPQMLLPRFEVRASAGAGALVASQDVTEYFGAPRDYIRKNLPSWAPANADVGIIENGGDSMWPTIHDGDLLVVVRGPSWRVVERGGIFVFTLDDRLLLKRLQVLDNGDLLIISDNKQYQPMTVARRELTERLYLHAQVFLTVGKPRNAAVSATSAI